LVWLAVHGIDGWHHGMALLGSIDNEMWKGFGIAVAKLTAAAIAFLVAVAVMRRLFAAVELAATRWTVLEGHDKAVASALLGLNHSIVTAGWLLLIVLCVSIMGCARTRRRLFVPEKLAGVAPYLQETSLRRR